MNLLGGVLGCLLKILNSFDIYKMGTYFILSYFMNHLYMDL